MGKLNGVGTPIEYLYIEEGEFLALHFESGISVMGRVIGVIRENNKNLLISFTDCTVLDRKETHLFEPAWGVYDMAVGESIVSVYSGAADKNTFEETGYRPRISTYHPIYSEKTRQLHNLYQQVRDCREQHRGYEQLPAIWKLLQTNYPDDWLCPLEILEILSPKNREPELVREITAYLKNKAQKQPGLKKLIGDGFYLIKHPVEQATV